MLRLLFLCFVFGVSCLTFAACDSASLNESEANPLVVLAAQFAEGSVGAAGSSATQPHEGAKAAVSASGVRHPIPLQKAAVKVAVQPPNLTTPW